MWHDVWHEQEIGEIITRMKQWLLERLPQQNTEPPQRPLE